MLQLAKERYAAKMLDIMLYEATYRSFSLLLQTVVQYAQILNAVLKGRTRLLYVVSKAPNSNLVHLSCELDKFAYIRSTDLKNGGVKQCSCCHKSCLNPDVIFFIKKNRYLIQGIIWSDSSAPREYMDRETNSST